MSNVFLDAALEYAERGIPVFPLQPSSKEPMKGSHGLLDASTDADQIRRWWAKTPNANIGARTGNGYVVLDFDMDDAKGEDGLETLREWESAHGELPETVTAITGRGGMHLWYRVGGNVQNSTNADKGVDVRGDGGFVVMPPSVHPNGTAYAWEVEPSERDVAHADASVLDFIDFARPKKRGRPRTSDPDAVGEGGRNDYLYRYGCSLRSDVKNTNEVITSALIARNNMVCKPPLPQAEIEKLIWSVLALEPGYSDEVKEQQKKAKEQKRAARFRHEKVARQLVEERGACMIDGVTPAIRDASTGRYLLGWDAFDAAIIELHPTSKISQRKEAKAHVKATAPNKSQSHWRFIAFKNGVLDVLTMELRDWRDDDVICNVIPHDWNPNADGELLDATLDKMACGDTSTRINLYEFIGICMLRSNTRLPFYPVLIGTGSNGKSSYIKLIKDVLGAENISALQPKEISAHFMGEHILGKLANLGDDIANAYLDGNDCGAIKRISTGENMFTDVKGTKGFYFEPYCTMVFSCNQFPRCADVTEGFMRRLFPIEFNARFSPSDADYDPLITEKLREEHVLEYACYMAVQALVGALQRNEPTPNGMSADVKRGIAAEGNTGLQWFNDAEITREEIIGKTKEEVYRDYTQWCDRNGYSRTAMASGTLSALIGTYWHLTCSKTAHRGAGENRRTVKVYAEKVPKGARGATKESEVKA